MIPINEHVNIYKPLVLQTKDGILHNNRILHIPTNEYQYP